MQMLLALSGGSQTTLLTGYMPVILIEDTSLRQSLLVDVEKEFLTESHIRG